MTQFFLPGFQPPPSDTSDDPAPIGPFAAQKALASYPNVSPHVRSVHGKIIGRAGEEFVSSILCRLGLEVFPASDDQPFDRLARFVLDDGVTIRDVRIQIKTVTAAKNGVFTFNMQQGYRGSPQGRRHYGADAYDIAALVILPHNAVRFTAQKRNTHTVRVAEIRHLAAFPQRTLFEALGLKLPQIGHAAPWQDDLADLEANAA